MLQPGTPKSWGIEDELIPLDGEIENLDALFTEDARRSYENDEGELIALPFMAVSVGVYYNKDIFAEIGAEKPQTWEEFIQAAELAQQAGYAPVANLITDGFLHVTLFNPIAASTLGGVEGREALLSGETCFNNELMARSFEQYLEFTQYLAPAVDEGMTYDAAAEFANGRAAMYIGGSWEITYFEGQVTAFDWGGFQVPALEGNAAYRILQPDTAMAIVASTQHREAALDFLRWLTEDEVLAAYNEELPGFFALRQGAVLPSNPYAREFINAEDAIDSIGLWFMPSGVPSGDDLAGGALAPLTNGEITPQEAADRIQAGLRPWYRPAQACEGLGDLIK
jgi:raffinose/stachyose/melibiose transport system substrate-binding protein